MHAQKSSTIEDKPILISSKTLMLEGPCQGLDVRRRSFKSQRTYNQQDEETPEINETIEDIPDIFKSNLGNDNIKIMDQLDLDIRTREDVVLEMEEQPFS